MPFGNGSVPFNASLRERTLGAVRRSLLMGDNNIIEITARLRVKVTDPYAVADAGYRAQRDRRRAELGRDLTPGEDRELLRLVADHSAAYALWAVLHDRFTYRALPGARVLKAEIATPRCEGS